MQEDFFRNEAIEAQARIDRLPQSMRVTGSLTRFMLGALAVSFVAGIAWSSFVEIPVRVQGSGLFIDTSGDLLKQVRAPIKGVVETFLVSEGTKVAAGAPVARLRLPELMADLEKATRNLEALKRQYVRTMNLQSIERKGDDRARQTKVKSLDRRIADLELSMARKRTQAGDIASLGGKRLTTTAQILAAHDALLKANQDLSSAKGDLSTLLADILVAEGRRERERLNLQLQIEQTTTTIKSFKAEIVRGNLLRSPVDGTVAEIAVDRSGLVDAGQVVLSIIPSNTDRTVDAVAYISLADGKLVKSGAKVLVRPAALPNGEQGTIRAVVESISDAPVSERALNRVLGNAGLVRQATRNGSPFAVKILLMKDAATPSGYSWTSGNGPDIRLTTGTPVEVNITVERVSLLSLALPALRRLFAIEAQALEGVAE